MKQQIISAFISAVHKNRYECLTDLHGEVVFAQLKHSYYATLPKEQVPTVGDWVDLVYNPMGDSQIIATHTRKSLLKRLDPSSFGKSEQLLAANVDCVFMLTSANQDFNIKRMRRYALIAKQSGTNFHVVINKADLVSEERLQELVLASDQAQGKCNTSCISCKQHVGIEELRRKMPPGSVSVFLGSSGVGKSSLVNELMQKEVMDTGDIRENDAKGRHTTTSRQVLLLPDGAMIIDTPGMRALGLWDAADAVDDEFDDIVFLAQQCRYSDCEHENEPGCAVHAAIKAGTLKKERFDEYRQLASEARRGRTRSKPVPSKAFNNKRRKIKIYNELDEGND